MPPATQSRHEPIDRWPLWWFAQLEAALRRNDRAGAAAAHRKLEQLGVEVRYRLPPLPTAEESPRGQ